MLFDLPQLEILRHMSLPWRASIDVAQEIGVAIGLVEYQDQWAEIGTRMHDFAVLQSLVLLMLANGTPVIAKRILGNRFAFPLDAGLRFLDQRPLFGSSKTIRGVLLSILVTAASAPLLGLHTSVGVLVAGMAMMGDLFSSFVKRRLNLPPSSQALGLDQVPESLLPLLACRAVLSLTAADIAFAVMAFFVGELVLSRLLYIAHVRDKPY